MWSITWIMIFGRYIMGSVITLERSKTRDVFHQTLKLVQICSTTCSHQRKRHLIGETLQHMTTWQEKYITNVVRVCVCELWHPFLNNGSFKYFIYLYVCVCIVWPSEWYNKRPKEMKETVFHLPLFPFPVFHVLIATNIYTKGRKMNQL